MTERIVKGNCQLCGKLKELVEGHVWSKFAYKRWVSDLAKGGSFVDLHKMEMSNRQYTRYWFCKKCDGDLLGSLESYAAEFCARVESQPTIGHPYDERLLRFLTSISWRTAKFSCENSTELARYVRGACRQWREYLLRRRNQIRPYTQHLFIVFDKKTELHKVLGGQVYPDRRLILTQVGPLLIVGLVERAGMSLRDLKTWDRSEISAGGGEIKPLSEWRVGSSVSLEFMQLLAEHVALMKQKVLERKWLAS